MVDIILPVLQKGMTVCQSNLYRVIISHHQSEYLKNFDATIPSVVVFDDLTPADISAVGDIPYIQRKPMGNRGANRNAGLNYWLSKNPSENAVFEFLDGDRFPVMYDDPIKEMSELDADILLYPCNADTRYARHKFKETLYMKGPGNPFFSCGFAITKKALDAITAFNNGVFFREEFDGWGGEDQYTGTVAGHLGLRCFLSETIELNGTVGGDSQNHNDYLGSMNIYLKLVLQNGLKETFLDNVGRLPTE